MTIKNEGDLEAALSTASEEDVPQILDQWMTGSTWGSEEEAYRLIQFIKIWDTFNIKMKNRDKRTGMVNAGISCKIQAHFTGLDKNGSTLKPHSGELLSYGVYGPDGAPKSKIKEDRLNDQIAHDSLQRFHSGRSDSKRKSAERLEVDRGTVRADRNNERYDAGVDLTIRVLQKICKK